MLLCQMSCRDKKEKEIVEHQGSCGSGINSPVEPELDSFDKVSIFFFIWEKIWNDIILSDFFNQIYSLNYIWSFKWMYLLYFCSMYLDSNVIIQVGGGRDMLDSSLRIDEYGEIAGHSKKVA